MSKQTPEQIVAAFRCLDTNMSCKDCYYTGSYTRCRGGALEHDAADLIRSQAARIRELEAQVVRCRDCQKCYYDEARRCYVAKPKCPLNFMGYARLDADGYCYRGERREKSRDGSGND